jgi:uncharacterized membrane protein
MATNTTSAAAQPIQSSSAESSERDLLRILGIFMTIIGTGIGIYLAYVKLSDGEAICLATDKIDCHSVQTSSYSEILGIPISLLGLGAYVTMLGIFVLEDRIQFLADFGLTILFSMTLFGAVYSGYLSYVEGFVLEKWCLWCVASAFLMLGLFILSATRLQRSFAEFEDFDDEEDDDE